MTRFLLLFLLTTVSISLQAQDTLRFSIYYNTDKFHLSPKELLELKASVQIPSNAVVQGITIFAYCDDLGSTEYNKALSERRAKALAAALHQIAQLEKVSIKAYGKGELQLLQDGDTLEMRRLNRRSEVLLVYSVEQNAKTPEEDVLPNLSELEVGQKMVLKNLLFVGGTRQFLPESIPVLDELVKTLKESPTVKVRIIGHVCCTGGLEGEDIETGKFNLSVIRAQTVYLYLVNHGIEKDRLSFIGKGGNEPLGGDIKYDRRVELEIVEK
ncbi:MAG TPA: hypothetical protein DIW47_05620 [Bacteroidetes bacterium]|nr:hypothetical protein [Bacteroidota bacterium]